MTGPTGDRVNITEYIRDGKVGTILNIAGAAETKVYQKVAVE